MLTFSRLGRMGNLGNQLFQIASTIGLAQKHGHIYQFPEWQYAKYFKGDFPVGPPPLEAVRLNEQHYHFHDWPIKPLTSQSTINYDLKGWLQSEKYWKRVEAELRQKFSFNEKFAAGVRNRFGFGMVFEKPTIAISVRRGDYVGNPNYELLPATYYIQALLRHFPDYQNYNIIFFSDDIPYCRVHFECLPNAFFADDLNAIEQLCLMSQCDHFIISNSTFAWWGAYLGEKEGTKIIRPAYLFAGPLLKNDAKDFYPERWTAFDHKAQKLNLSDVTFTIPVFHDHTDRRQNLDLSVCMLQRDFDTNVIIGEQGSNKFGYMAEWARYMRFDDMQNFHRTKMLNDMAMASETPIIVNWDCDVFVPPMQIWLAAEAVRAGSDMVYPYDGRFARVPRTWFAKVEHHLDIGIFGDTEFTGKNGKPLPISSVGGAIFFDKNAFIEGGMENEKMISYGPEDCERWDRFHALGFKVIRISGSLYHMDHFIGPNSSSRCPFFKANHAELMRIRAMKPEQLRAYVDSWPWRHKYTESYYDRISESAIVSAREVFAALATIGVTPKSVIDIGCAVGEWGKDMPFDYTGVDYKVPRRALLFPECVYYDYDLTSGKPFPIANKADLVLCLEVLEHIPEQHADAAVSLLCSLGDRILFSAAVPFQGGVGHVNEQWQSWWAKKFEANGFYPAERQLRNIIADNANIDIWYRQNIVLYEKDGKGEPVTDYVHPEMYANVIKSLAVR